MTCHESFFDPKRVMNCPHPHPRSKKYRAEPKGWEIDDCRPEDLLKIIVNGRGARRQGRPLSVFDVDGTIFDVSYRTLGIIHEWVESSQSADFHPDIVSLLEKTTFEHIGYSVKQTMENLGLLFHHLDVQKAFLSLDAHWKKRFFDGQSMLEYDLPFPGVMEFLNSLDKSGLQVCYLTGRYAPKMRQATLKQCSRFSLPCEPKFVYMKENILLDDYKFKSQTFAKLAQESTIAANFENEYANLYHMYPFAPSSIHVIMDSHHSGKQTSHLDGQIYRITGFLSDPT